MAGQTLALRTTGVECSQAASLTRGFTMTAVQSKIASSTVEVRSPADGRIVGSVPVDTAKTVSATARALRAAQPEWEAIGPRGRKH